MVPLSKLQERRSAQNLILIIAIEDDQLPLPGPAFVGAADADMVARTLLIAIGTAREQISRHSSRIVGESVPEPARDRVAGPICGTWTAMRPPAKWVARLPRGA